MSVSELYGVRILSSPHMMLWPAIIITLLALLRVYDTLFPCDSGFFIGGCFLGKLTTSVLVFESVVVYACLSFIMRLILGRFRRNMNTVVIFLAGIASLVIVFSSVFFILPGLFDVFMSPVIYLINFSSGSSPLAFLSTWRTQLDLFFPFEPKTVWQRIIGLLFFPFLP